MTKENGHLCAASCCGLPQSWCCLSHYSHLFMPFQPHSKRRLPRSMVPSFPGFNTSRRLLTGRMNSFRVAGRRSTPPLPAPPPLLAPPPPPPPHPHPPPPPPPPPPTPL